MGKHPQHRPPSANKKRTEYFREKKREQRRLVQERFGPGGYARMLREEKADARFWDYPTTFVEESAGVWWRNTLTRKSRVKTTRADARRLGVTLSPVPDMPMPSIARAMADLAVGKPLESYTVPELNSHACALCSLAWGCTFPVDQLLARRIGVGLRRFLARQLGAVAEARPLESIVQTCGAFTIISCLVASFDSGGVDTVADGAAAAIRWQLLQSSPEFSDRLTQDLEMILPFDPPPIIEVSCPVPAPLPQDIADYFREREGDDAGCIFKFSV